MSDLVEAVARAMYEREHPNSVWSRGRASPLWFFRAETAIAVVIERCAKVCEVSDAVEDATADWSGDPCEGAIAVENLKRFILPKPVDPLIRAIRAAFPAEDRNWGEASADALRMSMDMLGLEIVEKKP